MRRLIAGGNTACVTVVVYWKACVGYVLPRGMMLREGDAAKDPSPGEEKDESP